MDPSQRARDQAGQRAGDAALHQAERADTPDRPPRPAWEFGGLSLFPPVRASGSEPSLARSSIIQRKLVVGAVDDPLEHEADRVAD